MASLPNVTYDQLAQFYAKYKSKSIEDDFTVIDLGGREINVGRNTIFRGTTIIDQITSGNKPALFKNFKIGGVTYSYSFGTSEIRMLTGNIPERHKPVYVWKIYDGTFFFHRGAYDPVPGEECEYLMYFPRSGKVSTLFALAQSPLSVNNTLTFKEGVTPGFTLYENSIHLDQDNIDWGVFPILKIQIVDDTDEKWARCTSSARTVGGVSYAAFHWQDTRNNWSNDIANYSVYVN